MSHTLPLPDATLGLLRKPAPYSILAMAAYLMFASGGANASNSLGATSGECQQEQEEDGSCKPKPEWICNIGGADWVNKCKVGDEGC